MRTSERGILELCEHEGIVPVPYKDSVGVWTWGVGHTAAAGGPDPAEMNRAMPGTEHEMNQAIVAAIKQLGVDLRHYEDDVNQAVRVPLEQHEFDALVSFHFNTGGIHRARLTKAINAGQEGASKHFMGWLKPPEIRGRRTAEKRLYETGDYDANGTDIPVWGTNGNGRLTKPLRTIDGNWILEIMGRPKAPPKPVKVPDEVEQAIEDADKPAAQSTTIWALIAAAGGTATSAWEEVKSLEPTAMIAVAIVVAALIYVYRERLRKAKLGKIAKDALGL